MTQCHINTIWKNELDRVLSIGKESAPRGMTIKEIIGNQVKFDMKDPIVTLAARKMNYRFAFGEAWWILSGSNDLHGDRGISQFMKSYEKYSDDGVTLNGAYGPKFVEQLSWVAKTIAEDLDTRQAVISLWRERPGKSGDVPCTTTLQFFVRDGMLHCVTTMRSNDMIWGFCYDSFTFTLMTKMVQTVLRQAHNIYAEMGEMTLNQGSAHIYKKHWQEAIDWQTAVEIDRKWRVTFPHGWTDPVFDDRASMLAWLKGEADTAGEMISAQVFPRES